MTNNLKDSAKAQAVPADVAEQLAILKDDVRSLTESIAQLAQAKGLEFSHAANDQLASARDSANAKLNSAKAQATQLQDQANDFVRDQPAAALAIAAGLGFLIGMSSGRK